MFVAYMCSSSSAHPLAFPLEFAIKICAKLDFHLMKSFGALKYL